MSEPTTPGQRPRTARTPRPSDRALPPHLVRSSPSPGWPRVLAVLGGISAAAVVGLTVSGGQVDRLVDTVGSVLPTPSTTWLGASSPRYPAPVSLVTPGQPETEPLDETGFLPARAHPLSTFGVDVDTASYAIVRRTLRAGRRPAASSVRLEELVNYFDYDYPEPRGVTPFSTSVEVAPCPWNPTNRLARVGLRGRSIPQDQLAPSNLVFLLDVSGSMNRPDRLGLLKKALAMLVRTLTDRDRVAVVVYAGASGLLLPSTSCADRARILDALAGLTAGGSTNGGQGIELAYQVARENFLEGGVNRVLLATDGDFNVGVTDDEALVALIEAEARSGVFLSVLGFGDHGYQDAKLEKLSGHGNGNYATIDSLAEAEKTLVHELGGTLVTIAKDVKIQIEFNPRLVGSYRLLGYENRRLAARDFHDDKKDAGEIGAGHTVTAFYELTPPAAPLAPLETPASPDEDRASTAASDPEADPKAAPEAGAEPGLETGPDALTSDELMRVRLRFKRPDALVSELATVSVPDRSTRLADATPDFRFAASVAGWGMLLKASPHRGAATVEMLRGLAAAALGVDPFGHRAEFLELLDRTERGPRPPRSLVDQ